MRSAIRCRYGVAIPGEAALAPQRPGDRPFHASMIMREVLSPGEEVRGRALPSGELFLEVIAEPTGELEHRLGQHIAVRKGRIAAPADLDAGEQIGLGADQLVEPRRLELHLAEDLGVGHEADRGAPPIGCRPDMLDRPQRLPSAEALAVQLAVAGNLDRGVARQRVDDADPDAMQAARCGIGLARELAARVQHRQDDLERRLVRELGMRVDRHAAAIVDDRQPVADIQHHLDPRGMACDRLVHRIVEHLGGEMVQRPLIGTADVHARTPAHRLQPLQHLDRRRIIVGRWRGGGSEQIVGRGHEPGMRDGR